MNPSDMTPGAVDLEEAFFAEENSRLLEQLRQKTEQEERRELLRRVVSIKDEAFLDRLIALGIGPETAMALRIVPLVFVAWADGSMDDREREAILKAAGENGLTDEETSHKMLQEWLERKPTDRLLSLWKDYVRHLWERFTADEQLQMRKNLLESAHDVAAAAGGFLGLARVSAVEQKVLDDLGATVG